MLVVFNLSFENATHRTPYFVFSIFHLIFTQLNHDINDENNFIRSRFKETAINIFFFVQIKLVIHLIKFVKNIYDVYIRIRCNNFFARDKICVIYFIIFLRYFLFIENTRLQGHRYLQLEKITLKLLNDFRRSPRRFANKCLEKHHPQSRWQGTFASSGVSSSCESYQDCFRKQVSKI